MSELRRPTLPDRPDPVDRPAERADHRPRPTDMPYAQPIDYRKTVRAQKDFVRETRDQPQEGSREPTSSVDWKTGRPDASSLEARTIQRVNEGREFTSFSDAAPSRGKGRGSWDKVSEKREDITQEVHDTADTIDQILSRPRPTGAHLEHGAPGPTHLAEQYASHSAGDLAATVTAVAFISIDFARKVYGKFNDWKGPHDGDR